MSSILSPPPLHPIHPSTAAAAAASAAAAAAAAAIQAATAADSSDFNPASIEGFTSFEFHPSPISRSQLDSDAIAAATKKRLLSRSASEILQSLPQCKGCHNKAKLGCNNACCATCCKSTGLRCDSHSGPSRSRGGGGSAGAGAINTDHFDRDYIKPHALSLLGSAGPAAAAAGSSYNRVNHNSKSKIAQPQFNPINNSINIDSLILPLDRNNNSITCNDSNNIYIPSSIIGKPLTGIIEKSFTGGFSVSVVVAGIHFTGILLNEVSAVSLMRIPNDSPSGKQLSQSSTNNTSTVMRLSADTALSNLPQFQVNQSKSSSAHINNSTKRKSNNPTGTITPTTAPSTAATQSAFGSGSNDNNHHRPGKVARTSKSSPAVTDSNNTTVPNNSNNNNNNNNNNNTNNPINPPTDSTITNPNTNNSTTNTTDNHNPLSLDNIDNISIGDIEDPNKEDANKRRYIKSGLYSKRKQAELLAAGLPIVIPKRKKPKHKRNPSVPKGQRSAYVYFDAARRARLRLADPSEHAAIEAEFDWRRLSEIDKEPYKAFAEADKLRYHREMEEYNKFIAKHPNNNNLNSNTTAAADQDNYDSNSTGADGLTAAESAEAEELAEAQISNNNNNNNNNNSTVQSNNNNTNDDSDSESGDDNSGSQSGSGSGSESESEQSDPDNPSHSQ